MFPDPKRSPCLRHSYLPGYFLRSLYNRTGGLPPASPTVCQRDSVTDLLAQPNFLARLPSPAGSRSAIWKPHVFELQNAIWFLYPFLLSVPASWRRSVSSYILPGSYEGMVKNSMPARLPAI